MGSHNRFNLTMRSRQSQLTLILEISIYWFVSQACVKWGPILTGMSLSMGWTVWISNHSSRYS